MKLSDTVLNSIYDEIDMGLIVYIHKLSHKILATLDFENDYNAMDYIDDWKDILAELEADRDNYIQIEKMSSREAYLVMESFVESAVEDPKMQGRLEQALEGHKPFANFNHALRYDMDLRDSWFDFKKEQYKVYIAFCCES